MQKIDFINNLNINEFNIFLKKIYNDVKESNISLDNGIELLTLLIEHSDNAYRVIESIDVAVKIMGHSDELFKILENCLISDNFHGVRSVAAKELIHNFPNKCIAPLTWAIQHDESAIVIKEILNLVKDPANQHLGVLREEIEKRFLTHYGVLGEEAVFFLDFEISHPHLIKEYIDEGVKPSNAAVLAIFGSMFEIKLINSIPGDDDYHFYQKDTEGNVVSIIVGAGRDGRHLRSIPKQIYLLENLEELNLAWNGIESLPTTICRLKSLKYLKLSSNKIKKLPESIGDLKLLEKLVLQGNKLQKLPESIGDLKSLEELYLGENELQEIPESIGNLRSLEILSLSENNLKEIPESIGNLKSLEFLFLSENILQQIPETIGQLSSLKDLSLCQNNIQKIPESITNLKYLEILDLSENNIQEIPELIGLLNYLKTLFLDQNDIQKIPESITNLKSLKFLKIQYNKIQEIDDSVRKWLDSSKDFNY